MNRARAFPANSVGTIVKRILAPLTRHPLIATGVFASMIAVGHAIWICTHRQLGGIDPDEAGYLTAALSFQRSIDPAHPLVFVSTVLGSSTAPLVPLLSVVTLILGPRNIWAAMMVQPVLMVVSCVAIAGITRRWVGPLVAIAAGISYAVTPTVINGTQSYWLGLGAAASFVCTLWALLASDQGRNRWIWAYSIGLAAMLLSRTMMLGMLPGAVLAGLIVCWSTRRGLSRYMGSVLLAGVLAGPWWYSQWTWTIRYLTSYGYGKEAGLFGQGDVVDRISYRLNIMLAEVGLSWSTEMQLMVLVGIGLGILAIRGWLPKRFTVRTPVHFAKREAVAIGLAAAAGFAALVSTTNQGVWFELPVVAALFPLAWSVIGRGPITGKVLAACPFALFALFILPSAWWIKPPIAHPFPYDSTAIFPAHFEYGFAQYDPRFAPNKRSQQKAAAKEWWAASQRLERELRAITSDKPNIIFSMSGNFEMLNTNTVALAAELHAWTPIIWVPDTRADRRHIDIQLRSIATDLDGNIVEPKRGSTFERVLVLLEHDFHLFTPDAEVKSFATRARKTGWVDVSKFDLPLGGTVSILRFPEK